MNRTHKRAGMISNRTRRSVIASEKRDCKSLFSKILGLMFAAKLHDKGLVFYFEREQLNPIHMFFVFQSIDVIYLDSGKKVVEIARDIKPFTWYEPKQRSKYFIEVRSGAASDTRVGDSIEFEGNIDINQKNKGHHALKGMV